MIGEHAITPLEDLAMLPDVKLSITQKIVYTGRRSPAPVAGQLIGSVPWRHLGVSAPS